MLNYPSNVLILDLNFLQVCTYCKFLDKPTSFDKYYKHLKLTTVCQVIWTLKKSGITFSLLRIYKNWRSNDAFLHLKSDFSNFLTLLTTVSPYRLRNTLMIDNCTRKRHLTKLKKNNLMTRIIPKNWYPDCKILCKWNSCWFLIVEKQIKRFTAWWLMNNSVGQYKTFDIPIIKLFVIKKI